MEVQARHIFTEIFLPDHFVRDPCSEQRNPVLAHKKAIFEMLALNMIAPPVTEPLPEKLYFA